MQYCRDFDGTSNTSCNLDKLSFGLYLSGLVLTFDQESLDDCQNTISVGFDRLELVVVDSAAAVDNFVVDSFAAGNSAVGNSVVTDHMVSFVVADIVAVLANFAVVGIAVDQVNFFVVDTVEDQVNIVVDNSAVVGHCLLADLMCSDYLD